MRFFTMACLFCLTIASVGCMYKKNWSPPLWGDTVTIKDTDDVFDVSNDEAKKSKSNFWTAKFGESSGLDPRAKEVEKRLGY